MTVTFLQGTTSTVAGAPVRLAFERLGLEFSFQVSAGGYRCLVDRLRVQQPGEWAVIVRRGLEL